MSVVSSHSQQPPTGSTMPVSQENVDGFLDRLNSYIQDFKVLDNSSSGYLDVNQVKKYFQSKGLPEDGLLELTTRQKMDRLNVEQFAAAVEFSQLNKNSTNNGTNGTSDFNEVLRHCEEATKQLQGTTKTKAAHAGLLTNIVKELQNIIKLIFPLAFQKYTTDEASRGTMPCTFDNDTDTADVSNPNGNQHALNMKNALTPDDPATNMQSNGNDKEPDMSARDIVTPSIQGKDGRPSMKDNSGLYDNNEINLKNNDSSYRSNVLNALHTAGHSQNDLNDLEDQKKRDLEILPDENPRPISDNSSSLPSSAAALAAGIGATAALSHGTSNQAKTDDATIDNDGLRDDISEPNTVFTAHDGTDDTLKPSKSKRSVFSKIFGKSKDSKKDDTNDTTRSPSIRKSKSFRRSLSKRSRGINSPESEKSNALDSSASTPSIAAAAAAMSPADSDRSIPVAPPRKTTTLPNADLQDVDEVNTRNMSSSDSTPVPPPRKLPVNNDITGSDNKVYAPRLSDPLGTINNDADHNHTGSEPVKRAPESDASSVPAAISTTIEGLKDDNKPDQTARGIADDEPSTTTRGIDSTSPSSNEVAASSDISTPAKTAAAAGLLGGITSMFGSSSSKGTPSENVDSTGSVQNSRAITDDASNDMANNNHKSNTADYSNDPLPEVSGKLAKIDATLENDPFMASDHQKKASDASGAEMGNPDAPQANTQKVDDDNSAVRPGIVGMISAGILSMFSSSSKDNADESTRDIDNEPMSGESDITRDVPGAPKATMKDDTSNAIADDEIADAKPNSKLAKIDNSLRRSMLLSPGAKKNSTSDSSIGNRGIQSTSDNDSHLPTNGQADTGLNNKSNDNESDIVNPTADATEKAARPGLVGMLSSGIMSMFSSSNNVDESEKRNPDVEPEINNVDDSTKNTREVNDEPAVNNIESDKADNMDTSAAAISNDHTPVSSKLAKLDANINNTMLPSTNADEAFEKDSNRQAKKPDLSGELPAATIDSKNADDVATPSSTSSLGKLTAGLMGVFGSSKKGDNNDRSIEENVNNNTRDISPESLSTVNDTDDKIKDNINSSKNDVKEPISAPQSDINDVPGFQNPKDIASDLPSSHAPKVADNELETTNNNATLDKSLNAPTDRSVDKPMIASELPETQEQPERPDMNTAGSTSSLGKLAAGIMGVFGASTPKTEQPGEITADGSGSRGISDNVNDVPADATGSSPISREANVANTAALNSTDGDCQLCSRFNKVCKTQEDYKTQAAQSPVVQSNTETTAPIEGTRGMPSDGAQPADRSVDKPNLSGQLPKNALVDIDDSGDVDNSTPGSTGSIGRLAAGIMGMFSSSSLNDESETPDIDTNGKAFPMTSSNNDTRDIETAPAGVAAKKDLMGMGSDPNEGLNSSSNDVPTKDVDARNIDEPLTGSEVTNTNNDKRPSLDSKLTASMRDLKANLKNKMKSSDSADNTPSSNGESTADDSRPGLSARLSTGMKDLTSNIKDRMSPSETPSDSTFGDVPSDTASKESRPSISSKFRSSMKDLKANIKDKMGPSSEDTTEAPVVDVATENDDTKSRPGMSSRLSSGMKDLKANLKKLNSSDSKNATVLDDTPAEVDNRNIKAAPIATTSTPFDEIVEDNETDAINSNRSVDKPTLDNQMPKAQNNNALNSEINNDNTKYPIGERSNQLPEVNNNGTSEDINASGSSSSLGKLAAGIMGVFGSTAPKTEQENADTTDGTGSRDIDNSAVANPMGVNDNNKSLERDVAGNASVAPSAGNGGDCQLCAKFNKVCKTQADFEAQNAQAPNHSHAAQQQPTVQESTGNPETDRSVDASPVDGQTLDTQTTDGMNTSNSSSSLGKLAAGIMGVFGSSTAKDGSQSTTSENGDATSGTRDMANGPSTVDNNANEFGNVDMVPEKHNADVQPLIDVDTINRPSESATVPAEAQNNRSAPDAIDKSNNLNLTNAVKLDAPTSESAVNSEPLGQSTELAGDMTGRDVEASPARERPNLDASGSTSSLGKLAAGIMGVFGSSSPTEEASTTTTTNDTRDINTAPDLVDNSNDDISPMSEAKRESKLAKLDNSYGDLSSAPKTTNTVPEDNSAAARSLPVDATDAQFDDNATGVDKSRKMSPVAAGSMGALAGGLMAKLGSKPSKENVDEPVLTSNNSLPESDRNVNTNLPSENNVSTGASAQNSSYPTTSSDKGKLAKLDARMSDMLPSTADSSNMSSREEPAVPDNLDQTVEQSKPYESFDDVNLNNDRRMSSTGDMAADDADLDGKKSKKLGMLAAMKGMFSSSKDLLKEPREKVDDTSSSEPLDAGNTRDIKSTPNDLSGISTIESGPRNDIRLSNSDFYDDAKNPFSTEGSNDGSGPKLPPFADVSGSQQTSMDSGVPKKLSKLDANVDNTLLVAPGTDNQRSKSGTGIDDATPSIENAAYIERPISTDSPMEEVRDIGKSDRDLDNIAVGNNSLNVVGDDEKTAEGASDNATPGSSSSLGALAAGIKTIFSSTPKDDTEKPSEDPKATDMRDTSSTRDISSQPPKIDMEFGDSKLDSPVAPPRKSRNEVSGNPTDDSYGTANDYMPTKERDVKEPKSNNNDEFDSMMNNVGAGMLTASAAATMAKHADPPAKEHLSSGELPKRDESLNATMADSRFSELDNNDTVNNNYGARDSIAQEGSVQNKLVSQQQPRELTINTERPPEVPAHREASASLKSPSFQDRSAADAIKVVYESMTSKLMSGPKSSSASGGEERVLKVRQGFGNFAGFGVKCVADDAL